MLPIDPGDGQGSVTPAQPPRDILPAQAMAYGGTTIIRPGAVAWGGLRDARDQADASGEAVERAIAAVARDAGRLPGLIAELTRTRMWVPLPARGRPFTDGTAVRLPLVSAGGTDFVPCFTSAGRLTAWADAAPVRPRDAAAADGGMRAWRRAGDARVVPHIVVGAAGLARRLPPGLGLALNPDGAPSLPLYPECVSYLARLPPGERVPAQRSARVTGPHLGLPDVRPPDTGLPDTGPPNPVPLDLGSPPRAAAPAYLVGHPPAEPSALLRAATDRLRMLPCVGQASRAWLSVPGRGEGLIVSVTVDRPASEADRGAVIDAVARACAAVALRVPFPVDVTFPGEFPPDAIDDWVSRNTRPFYARSGNPPARAARVAGPPSRR
jgi:hypothetical protein